MQRVAKAIIYDRSDQMLVLRRSGTHPKYPYHVDFPGGIVEDDENGFEGVKREIMEEVSLHLNDEIIELVYEKNSPDNFHHELYITRIDEDRPDITLSWEHSGYDWVSVSDFLKIRESDIADNYIRTVIEYLSKTIKN
ncbi:MAG: NUDIX hydrolase [Candidatus Saccharimonadales bacterium]